MAKKDKKKDEKPADKGGDKKGGLFGRIFGGKGDKAATPRADDDAMDAPTIPPEMDDMNPELAKTIPPVDRDDVFGDPADALTIAPGKPMTTPGGDGGLDPFDDPAEARTIPPFDPPKSVKGAQKGAPKPVAATPFDPPASGDELDPFSDPAEARTLPPFDRPKNLTPPGKKGAPAAPPPMDIFSADAMTLPPTPAAELDDIPLDAPTLAPQHLKGQVPPRAAKKPRPIEDDGLTQDPLLTPQPRDVAKDPFAFEDDLLGDAGAPPPPAPARAAAPDDLGFGDDVADLLAPMPASPAPPVVARAPSRPATGADPFGAALADDPFEFGAATPATPNKTDEIPSFDVELGGAPATPAAEPMSERDEKTLEMDRPPPGLAAAPPRRESGRVALPPPAPRKTLFASAVTSPDGSCRFGAPAKEVQLDHEKRTLFASPVEGGWQDVPAFAAVLSDGSVVGRLPAGVTIEADGSFVVPAAAASRAPASDGTGRRVPAFPAGVLVDRAAGFAYAPADVAPLVAGSPEPALRLDDGALVFTLPADAKWGDDGSYSLPAEAPRFGSTQGDTVVEKKDASSHGAPVWKATYLGCEEVVFEDGWASLELPKTARVEGELVLLPATSRLEAGSPPELLDVEARADGWLALRLPSGYVPEGDMAWLPPADIASDEPADTAETDWGDPIDELDSCGIHESLYANGWTRLDLPPGARVVGRKVVLPAEYAHAGDARTRAQFDREADGSLVFELPLDAEPLGATVLIPPEGVRSSVGGFSTPAAAAASAPAPATASDDAPLRRSGSSSSATASSSESALPPGGAGIGPKTKGLDRFRVKKAAEEDEKKPEETKAEDKKPEEPKAEDKKPEEPKAEDKKPEEPKADEPKPDEPRSEEKKAEDELKPEDGKDSGDGAEGAPEASASGGKKRRKKG